MQLLPSATRLSIDLRSTRDVGYSNALANGDEFALAHALTNPLPFHTQQNPPVHQHTGKYISATEKSPKYYSFSM